MAPRPNWKGYLKLSLVSCPVALYTAASSSERIALHMLDRRTDHRVRRQLVDSETGQVVEDDDLVKGYEIARGEHVMLEDEELNSIALESTHTIDIDQFVPRRDVDEIYVDTPYYLVPNDEVGQEAFAVIRDAMKGEGMAGLGRVVLYRRERVVMLEPRRNGILATTLRYAYEVRNERPYFDEVPKLDVPGDMLDLAKHILRTKTGKFDPARFADRYEQALTELIKAKQAGKAPKGPPPAPRPSNVINLMDALRRSIEAGDGGPSASDEPRASRTKGKPARNPPRSKTSARRPAGRSTRASHPRKAG